MIVVLDTNILVSELYRPVGNASTVLSSVLMRRIIPCYDYRIMNEYRDVLSRPGFGFSPGQINDLLTYFTEEGMSVKPDPLPGIEIPDESDRPFLEVAKFCNVPLITGNLKHYPNDPLIISLADFCTRYL